jgi:hypothetical protein
MVMSNIRQNRIDKVWNNSMGGHQRLLVGMYPTYGKIGMQCTVCIIAERNNVARGLVMSERTGGGWLKCNIDAAFHEGVGITLFWLMC